MIKRWSFGGDDILNREPMPVVSTLMSTIHAARNAELRLAKRIAALQTIEAIREFAARNGSLPTKLDVLGLPAMLDPETNAPFYYESNGRHAVLREPAPRGLPPMVGRDYLIELRSNPTK